MESELAKGMRNVQSVIDRLLGNEELCEKCEHPVRLHGDKYGCQFEPGDTLDGTRAKPPCGCMEHQPENSCESCGAPGTHLRGYDVCPTDRGDERRYIEQWLCDDCEPDRR